MKGNFEGIPCEVSDYNSNNSWGFGGSRGKKYKFNDNLWLIVGKAGTRHHGEFPHTTLTWETHERYVRPVDLSGNSTKELQRAKVWIEAILNNNVELEEVDHILTAKIK